MNVCIVTASVKLNTNGQEGTRMNGREVTSCRREESFVQGGCFQSDFRKCVQTIEKNTTRLEQDWNSGSNLRKNSI